MTSAYIVRSPSNYASRDWSGGGLDGEQKALPANSETPLEGEAPGPDKPAGPGGQERLYADGVVARERVREQVENAKKAQVERAEEPPAYVPTPPPDDLGHVAKEQAVIAAANLHGSGEAGVDAVKDMGEGLWEAGKLSSAFAITAASGYADATGVSSVIKFAAKAAGALGIPEVESLVGFVLDDYTEQKKAELKEGADAMMGAAKELISDPEGVLKAVVDGYMAEFEYADALREAYESGHADMGALYESERIRAKVTAELAVLGIETVLTGVGGAGLLLKGLRAAGAAGKLAKMGDAASLAKIMGAGRQAREKIIALKDRIAEPNRTERISMDEIRAASSGWFDPVQSRGPDGDPIVRTNDGGSILLQPPGSITCSQHSVAMVLHTLDRKVPVDEIVRSYPPSLDVDKHYSTMQRALRDNGVENTLFSEADAADLIRHTSEGRPAIATVQTGPDRFHSVVVDGVTTRGGQKVVAIRDPGGVLDGGVYYEDFASFQSRFEGTVIMVDQ